jgi:leucine dehydrogenase
MDATFTTGKELQNGSRFGQLSFDDHEQIVFCNEGLKAIIGIIILWDQLWEERMFNYANEEALNDVCAFRVE